MWNSNSWLRSLVGRDLASDILLLWIYQHSSYLSSVTVKWRRYQNNNMSHKNSMESVSDLCLTLLLNKALLVKHGLSPTDICFLHTLMALFLNGSFAHLCKQKCGSISRVANTAHIPLSMVFSHDEFWKCRVPRYPQLQRWIGFGPNAPKSLSKLWESETGECSLQLEVKLKRCSDAPVM